MLVLDATAGNRRMWNRGARGKTLDIVYMDYEYRLAVPPTVFADFKKLPFRDNVFGLTIFDPPYHVNRSGETWIFNNPDHSKKGKTKAKELQPYGHYGYYLTKNALVINLIHGAKEFKRISRRLCLKWGEGTMNIWNVVGIIFGQGWREVYRYRRPGRGAQGKSNTYWVTFVKPQGS